MRPRFVLYIDKAGEIRFRLIAKNGEIIIPTEGFLSKQGCLRSINAIKECVKTAIIIDRTDHFTEAKADKEAMEKLIAEEEPAKETDAFPPLVTDLPDIEIEDEDE